MFGRRSSWFVVGASIFVLAACGKPAPDESADPIGGPDGGDVSDTVGTPDGGGAQTEFTNLPATVESSRGEQGSFEVAFSGDEDASSQLEVISNGCGFEVEIDAAGVVSWECGSEQPVACDVSIGVSDGSAQATLSVVCANRLPEVSAVAVSPTQPSLISEVRCDYDFSDADADADQSQIEWIRGGELAGSGAIYTGARAPGDVISCRVTPDDGWDAGTAVDSDDVTIGEAAARSLGDFVQGASRLHGVRAATRLGDAVYFRASHESLGHELWRLDLATQSVQLVRDFMDGPGSGAGGRMQVVGSTLYFSANDGVHGTELWSTDGTTQGTSLVADTLAGIESGQARHLTKFDQTLYYVTKEDGGYASALWRLDPATGQPVSVRSRISGDPALDKGAEFAGDLYFPGGISSRDLLRLSPSQGVSVLPTTASGSGIGNVVATAQSLYFTKGRTLWRSDGTSSGTEPMSGFSEVIDLLVYQDELYISERSSPGAGYEFNIYRYSDTASNPATLVGSFPTDSSSLYARFLGQNANGVIFKAPHPTEHSHRLWVTDGTSAATNSLVDDVYIDGVDRDGDVLYFAGRASSANRYGLWRTDGTSEGTERVTRTGHGRGLYRPEFSVAAGVVLLDPGELHLPSEVVWPHTNTLTQLTVNGLELGSFPQEVAVRGQDAVISMRDGFIGYSLQYFDRAADSVREIEHNLLGSALALGEAATKLTSVGERVYFNAGTDDAKYLWWTDGTDEGTAYLVRTIGGNRPKGPHSLVALDDKVIFGGFDPGIHWEPWVSDGTEDGSFLLANIDQNINGGSDPSEFVRIGDQVYFLAKRTSYEQSLWVTDGTTSGTQRISSDYDFLSLREVDGTLYFGTRVDSTSRIGRYQPDTGQTTLLPELPDNNEAGQWAAAGGSIFVANDRQDELVWRLDGGTFTLIDGDRYTGNRTTGLIGAKDRVFWMHKEDGMWSVRSADPSSSAATVVLEQLHAQPTGVYVLDGRIIFETLDDGVSRLFISDGTPEGTVPLLGATSELKNVQPLARTTTGIFVSAYTSDQGQELWLIE